MAQRYQGTDPILTDISLGYQNAAYIAGLLLPALPVKHQSGKHFVYDKGMFRSEDAKRGPGSRSKEVTHNISTGLTFFCEDHALKEFVPDEDVDNAPAGIDPAVDATQNVTEKLLVDREVEAASILLDTGTITQNATLSGTSQWSDNNSDPVAAIRAAKATVRDSIMVDPNTLMVSKKVFDKLVDHPAIVERVKYSQLGVLNADLLARFFDVDRVIIGGAKKNGSVEGQADSMSDIWGRDALLAFINPRLGQKTVSLGVTYQWKNKTVERLNGTDERDRRGQFIRVGDDYRDAELIAAGAAYLFKDAVAA